MKPIRWTNLVGLLSALLALAATGVAWQGQRQYDPATEMTIKGTVEDVKRSAGPRGGPGGVHLIVKTEAGGAMEVRLGPARFLETKQFAFAKGDLLQIVGSKVKGTEKDVLIAREVKKGDKTLTLRNAQGIPEWSAGRGRP